MDNKRLARERVTIEKMIVIYCQAKHKTAPNVCPDCRELLHYAMQRLQQCKFGDNKPVCAKCSIHCYRKDMRERVLAVMRYVGPRMMYRHPLLALYHLIDTLKSGASSSVGRR